MYKDFSEYWEAKGPVLTKLGIDKDSAYMIWCDAVNALGSQLLIATVTKK